MRTIRSGAAILALAVAGSTACSINLNAEQYVNKEHKTFAVTGKADVELKTFDGSIEVTSWDKPEVSITIERRADTQAEAEALKVTAEQTGSRSPTAGATPATSAPRRASWSWTPAPPEFCSPKCARCSTSRSSPGWTSGCAAASTT